jgi:hypothetical protein
MAIEPNPGNFEPAEEYEGRSASVEDPEGLNRRLRLRSLHEAQQHFIDTRNAVEDARLRDNIGENAARKMVRTALENYLMLAEPVITATDEGEDYWNSVELGEVVIPPPDEHMEWVRESQTVVHAETSPLPIPMEGLEDIMTVPSPLSVEFDAARRVPHRGIERQSSTATAEISLDVLKTAFRKVNMKLRDFGLDLEPQEEEEYELKYAHLIDDAEAPEDIGP